MKSILSFNRFLSVLNVSGNFIGNKGLAFICEGLLQGPNQILLKLNIALNDINANGIDHLYETLALTKIKELNLSRNPLKNAGIKKIGDILNKGGLNLETLYVQDCEFNNMGCVNLYQGIKRNQKLRHLYLDDNNLAGR